MSGAVESMNFQDLIDAVEALPLDDQSMLIEIIQKHIIEKRRIKLIADINESREDFERGNVKCGTVEEIMRYLDD